MQEISIFLLELAEKFYLWAHNWLDDGASYYAPDDLGFSAKAPHTRIDAVMHQRNFDYNSLSGNQSHRFDGQDN